MRRRAARLALSLLFSLLVTTPSWAVVAAIETSAPLNDHSQESIETALKEAIRTAVKGAVAMGLPWVQVNQAVVFSDAVLVKVLASDTEIEDDDTPDDDTPAPGSVRPTGIEI